MSKSSTRGAPGLSSGILGMKFMRKDEDAEDKPVPAEESSTSAAVRNKFDHGVDPSSWALGEHVRPVSRHANSAEFNDIYGAVSAESGGRKVFGGRQQAGHADDDDRADPVVSGSGSGGRYDSRRKSKNTISGGAESSGKVRTNERKRGAERRTVSSKRSKTA